MKHLIYLVALIALIQSVPTYAAGGGGSSGGGFSQPRKQLTPDQKAAVAYDSGIKHRDKAAKYDDKAAGASSDKKLAKLEKKAAKEYGKAIKDYEKAIRYAPGYFEVHGSLGYALRKVGRYAESLDAYNESLRLNPSYGNAIEYRGEAYLGLNRIDDAKDAYMTLFNNEPALASQLLIAMSEWVVRHRDNAVEVDGTSVENFAVWVQQRTELASYTQPPTDAAAALWAEST
jgi:tetratricopeptide (TPR) repeat protein